MFGLRMGFLGFAAFTACVPTSVLPCRRHGARLRLHRLQGLPGPATCDRSDEGDRRSWSARRPDGALPASASSSRSSRDVMAAAVCNRAATRGHGPQASWGSRGILVPLVGR